MQLSSDLKYCPSTYLEETMNTIKMSSQDDVSALGIDTTSLGIWLPTFWDSVMVSCSRVKMTFASSGPRIYDHHNVSKHQEPNMQDRSVTY